MQKGDFPQPLTDKRGQHDDIRFGQKAVCSADGRVPYGEKFLKVVFSTRQDKFLQIFHAGTPYDVSGSIMLYRVALKLTLTAGGAAPAAWRYGMEGGWSASAAFSAQNARESEYRQGRSRAIWRPRSNVTRSGAFGRRSRMTAQAIRCGTRIAFAATHVADNAGTKIRIPHSSVNMVLQENHSLLQ